MRILGLIATDDLEEHRYKNIRSSVFYDYPNGAAPLTGLTSMLDEEETDDPEFFWHEKRMGNQRSVLKNRATTVVFTGTSSPYSAVSADFTWTKGTNYGVCVEDPDKFRVGHTITIKAIDDNGDPQDLFGRVEEVVTSPQTVLIVKAVKTEAEATDHDASGHAGNIVFIVGSAYSQGSRAGGVGPYQTPIRPGNYTQIFKTPFELTGTMAKVPLKYDEDGLDNDLAAEHALFHMIEIEKAFIWGRKEILTGSNGKPEYYTGGFEHFLRLYESQYSIFRGGNGVDSGPDAITSDADDDKRIIENLSGSISRKQLEKFYERVFRVTNNKANEKLVMLGNGALSVLNELYDGKVTFNSNLPVTNTFGIDITAHRTPFGTVYYKTHPLFNEHPEYRNSMLILDVNNLKYRYMNDRDTHLKPNIEENDADYRKDQWLTEAGLEFNFPESCMWIHNVVQADY